jgi:hypothetical protein
MEGRLYLRSPSSDGPSVFGASDTDHELEFISDSDDDHEDTTSLDDVDDISKEVDSLAICDTWFVPFSLDLHSKLLSLVSVPCSSRVFSSSPCFGCCVRFYRDLQVPTTRKHVQIDELKIVKQKINASSATHSFSIVSRVPWYIYRQPCIWSADTQHRSTPRTVEKKPVPQEIQSNYRTTFFGPDSCLVTETAW